MNPTLSQSTTEFTRAGAPFRAVHRFPRASMSGWIVRSKLGEDIALCDDEDAALAVVESLNALESRTGILPVNPRPQALQPDPSAKLILPTVEAAMAPPPQVVGRSDVKLIQNAFPFGIMEALRSRLATLEEQDSQREHNERERQFIAGGNLSDYIRMDAAWCGAWKWASKELRAAIGEHLLVSWPVMVVHRRTAEQSIPWHQDIAYERAKSTGKSHEQVLTVWIPLDEDPQHRSTVEFHSRNDTRQWSELPHKQIGNHRIADHRARLDVTGRIYVMELYRGDCLLFGDLIPHRGYCGTLTKPERTNLEMRLVRRGDALPGKDYFDIENDRMVKCAAPGNFLAESPEGRAGVPPAPEVEPLPTPTVLTEALDWSNAWTHFVETREAYEKLRGRNGVNVEFALRSVFPPLQARFDAGERTPELHKEMMSVE